MPNNRPQLRRLDAIIAAHKDAPGSLLTILEHAQKITPHQYLTKDALAYIAQKTGTPLSQVYGVASFYAFFNLKPQGAHSIVVCRGTACHTRRSKLLLDFLTHLLGLEAQEKAGEETNYTTADNKFTLRTVACFGQCALAPVVEVDGKIYSHMTEAKLKGIVRRAAGRKR